jgi:hypothetical protein
MSSAIPKGVLVRLRSRRILCSLVVYALGYASKEVIITGPPIDLRSRILISAMSARKRIQSCQRVSGKAYDRLPRYVMAPSGVSKSIDVHTMIYDK